MESVSYAPYERAAVGEATSDNLNFGLVYKLFLLQLVLLQ